MRTLILSLAALFIAAPANAETLLTTIQDGTPFAPLYASNTQLDSVGFAFGDDDGLAGYASTGFPLLINPEFTLTVIEVQVGPILLPITIDFDFEPNIEDVTQRVDSSTPGFSDLVSLFGSPMSPTVAEFVIKPERLDDLLGTDSYSSPMTSIWNDYVPPNGVTLHGSPYTLSAIEFKLTSYEVMPEWTEIGVNNETYRTINRFHHSIGFDLMLYGQVPEPASFALLFAGAMFIPRRLGRRS